MAQVCQILTLLAALCIGDRFGVLSLPQCQRFLHGVLSVVVVLFRTCCEEGTSCRARIGHTGLQQLLSCLRDMDPVVTVRAAKLLLAFCTSSVRNAPLYCHGLIESCLQCQPSFPLPLLLSLAE